MRPRATSVEHAETNNGQESAKDHPREVNHCVEVNIFSIPLDDASNLSKEKFINFSGVLQSCLKNRSKLLPLSLSSPLGHSVLIFLWHKKTISGSKNDGSKDASESSCLENDYRASSVEVSKLSEISAISLDVPSPA